MNQLRACGKYFFFITFNKCGKRGRTTCMQCVYYTRSDYNYICCLYDSHSNRLRRTCECAMMIFFCNITTRPHHHIHFFHANYFKFLPVYIFLQFRVSTQIMYIYIHYTYILVYTNCGHIAFIYAHGKKNRRKNIVFSYDDGQAQKNFLYVRNTPCASHSVCGYVVVGRLTARGARRES